MPKKPSPVLDDDWSATGIGGLSLSQIAERIVRFEEDEPHDYLGPHFLKGPERCVVLTYVPRAVKAWVVLTGSAKKIPMTRIHDGGVYAAVIPDIQKTFDYHIRYVDETGYETQARDPYAFGTWTNDDDLYLYGEGNHFKSYEKFGAHATDMSGTAGVHFTVWAPNAKSVSVVGNFNHWIPGSHAMSRIKHSGVWALFIPGLSDGEVYKYAIKTPEDSVIEKADPYAFYAEQRPHTASVVTRTDQHVWKDSRYMAERARKNFLKDPISVYEMHLGSWRRDAASEHGFMNYRQMAKELVAYVKDMGFTHIELLPVMEHPLDMSWGYQVISFYAPSSRFGSPEDFMYFVDTCHQNDIGVILDWVPSHFPKDSHGLNGFDGRQIYAYDNWRKGEHLEWGTLVFDYGRHEVRNFLISSALFWLDKYHIDGLRVDAVASMLYLDYSRKAGEWEPNIYGGNENLEAVDFLKKFNEVVHSLHPGVLTIAEESTAFGGVSRPTYLNGLGFSMKWNMGWMHDSLEYFAKEPLYRKWHQGSFTFSMIYAYSENFMLPISHDEVVYGKQSLLYKMPGDEWQQSANYRLFLTYMFTHPGKKLLFMGSEFAQGNEWNYNTSLDWHVLNYDRHRQAQALTRDLNALYRKHPALHEMDFESGGFEWIDFSDAASSIASFVRWPRSRNECILVVLNMTPVSRPGYRLGVPDPGFYEEIFNSDSEIYGGSNTGNYGGVNSESTSCHGRPHSVNLQLPPLAAVVLRCRRNPAESLP